MGAEYGLGAEEAINGKVEFTLVDLLYNLRGDRNEESMEYCLLISEYRKDPGPSRSQRWMMEKIIGDLMKPGANSFAFCSSLQFPL